GFPRVCLESLAVSRFSYALLPHNHASWCRLRHQSSTLSSVPLKKIYEHSVPKTGGAQGVSLIHLLEHPREVEIWRELERCKPITLNAESAERFIVGAAG